MRHEQFDNTSRRGWETNSSSSHSLVLDPLAKAVFREAAEFGFVKDRVLTIHGNEDFGWEWEIWTDPSDKVNYLLIDGFPPDRMIRLLIANLDIDDVKIAVLQDVEGIGGRSAGMELKGGSIDHQSVGTTAKIRSLSDEEVWAFITNPNNMIRGGNDNEEGPW